MSVATSPLREPRTDGPVAAPDAAMPLTPPAPPATAMAPDLALGGAVYRALFAKRTSVSSAIALAASLALPRGGELGFSLCWWKRWTDLPCPGCGLTRSFVCLSHLRWHDALQFHQLGPLVYLIAVVSALSLVIGEKNRLRVARLFSVHQRAASLVYWGFISSFIAFGLVRLVIVWLWPGTAFANV